jgi:hypothetical protein
MTTERHVSSRDVGPVTSALEQRLYVAALLAAVYAVSWRAIDGHAPAQQIPISAAPSSSAPQRVLWIDDVPANLRPAIDLPAGWQIATARQSSSTHPVRASSRQVPRVRTRSS